LCWVAWLLLLRGGGLLVVGGSGLLVVVGGGLLVGGGGLLVVGGSGLLVVGGGLLGMLKLGGGLQGCQNFCRNWGAAVEDVVEVLSQALRCPPCACDEPAICRTNAACVLLPYALRGWAAQLIQQTPNLLLLSLDCSSLQCFSQLCRGCPFEPAHFSASVLGDGP
jgi:hypothetical protein